MPRRALPSRFHTSAAPPPEALAGVARAAERWEELASEGLFVSFEPTSGGLRMALSDSRGELVQRLSGGDVLALAAG